MDRRYCSIYWRFHKKYNEESHKGYFLEVDVQYPEKIHELHHDLPFLSERIKIEKIEKLVTYLHDKTEYVIHIRIIKFNQKAWLKPYNDMTTKLRQKAKKKKFWRRLFPVNK